MKSGLISIIFTLSFPVVSICAGNDKIVAGYDFNERVSIENFSSYSCFLNNHTLQFIDVNDENNGLARINLYPYYSFNVLKRELYATYIREEDKFSHILII